LDEWLLSRRLHTMFQSMDTMLFWTFVRTFVRISSRDWRGGELQTVPPLIVSNTARHATEPASLRVLWQEAVFFFSSVPVIGLLPEQT
jgi:phosphatidylserine/phosphatidylglycerophosphate/cardiolipin synthase-like enzyme